MSSRVGSPWPRSTFWNWPVRDCRGSCRVLGRGRCSSGASGRIWGITACSSLAGTRLEDSREADAGGRRRISLSARLGQSDLLPRRRRLAVSPAASPCRPTRRARRRQATHCGSRPFRLVARRKKRCVSDGPQDRRRALPTRAVGQLTAPQGNAATADDSSIERITAPVGASHSP